MSRTAEGLAWYDPGVPTDRLESVTLTDAVRVKVARALANGVPAWRVALAAGYSPTATKRQLETAGYRLSKDEHVLELKAGYIERAKHGLAVSVENAIRMAEEPVKTADVTPDHQLQVLTQMARLTGAYAPERTRKEHVLIFRGFAPPLPNPAATGGRPAVEAMPRDAVTVDAVPVDDDEDDGELA